MKAQNPKKQPSAEIEYSQMSDIQKTQFLLGNQTRLMDAEKFINNFQSFEEPTVDSPKVKKTTKRNKKN
mgnify:CR=1 FL=1